MTVSIRAAWLAALLLVLTMAQAPAAYAADTPPCPLGATLTLDPNSPLFLTAENYYFRNQQGLNCYGWQMFVALNWPVDPAWPANPARAGEPDRQRDLASWGVPPSPGTPMTDVPVWSTYKDASEIFLPHGRKPTAWGVSTPLPSSCQAATALRGMPRLARVLRETSKAATDRLHSFNLSSGTQAQASHEIMEADGGWLTDQAGKLVYFERKVGLHEFNFIVDNGLYDAATQLSFAASQKGFYLPVGQAYGSQPPVIETQAALGAFEVKGAWRNLTGHAELYDRYLTSVVWTVDPESGHCSQQVVGLVGLHIIHKTPAQPDFVWATFEHVDNVPDGQPVPAEGYAFNAPDCQDKACIPPNQPRIDCSSGTCKDLFKRTDPVQVTREQQTPGDLVTQNQQIQQLFAPGSVFRNYKLVNVLWDGSPNAPSTPMAPRSYGTFESDGSLKVANTTMETYIQNQSCDYCHASAALAGQAKVPDGQKLSADFSFLFGTAGSAVQPSLVRTIREVGKD